MPCTPSAVGHSTTAASAGDRKAATFLSREATTAPTTRSRAATLAVRAAKDRSRVFRMVPSLCPGEKRTGGGITTEGPEL